jgi:hypothetical protein
MTDAVPAVPKRRRVNGQHPPPAHLPAKPSSLLEAIIYAASDPTIDIAKVEHLVRLKKEIEAAEAEKLFNEALAAAQAEMVPIVADAVNSEVGRAHRYASYAQLDRAVRPIYSRHGLSVTFNTGERSTDAVVEVTSLLRGGAGCRAAPPRRASTRPCRAADRRHWSGPD